MRERRLVTNRYKEKPPAPEPKTRSLEELRHDAARLIREGEHGTKTTRIPFSWMVKESDFEQLLPLPDNWSRHLLRDEEKREWVLFDQPPITEAVHLSRGLPFTFYGETITPQPSMGGYRYEIPDNLRGGMRVTEQEISRGIPLPRGWTRDIERSIARRTLIVFDRPTNPEVRMGGFAATVAVDPSFGESTTVVRRIWANGEEVSINTVEGAVPPMQLSDMVQNVAYAVGISRDDLDLTPLQQEVTLSPEDRYLNEYANNPHLVERRDNRFNYRINGPRDGAIMPPEDHARLPRLPEGWSRNSYYSEQYRRWEIVDSMPLQSISNPTSGRVRSADVPPPPPAPPARRVEEWKRKSFFTLLGEWWTETCQNFAFRHVRKGVKVNDATPTHGMLTIPAMLRPYIIDTERDRCELRFMLSDLIRNDRLVGLFKALPDPPQGWTRIELPGDDRIHILYRHLLLHERPIQDHSSGGSVNED